MSKSPFDELRYGHNYTTYPYAQKTTDSNQNNNEDNAEQTQSSPTPNGDALKAFSPLDEDIIDTVIKPKKTKEQRIRAGLIVGTSAFTLAGITYALSRGKIVKFGSNLINSLSNRISGRIEKLEKKDTLSTFETLYFSSLQNMNNISQKVRGTILNYTPIKDSLFSRFFKEKLNLKKPCESLTSRFRKLSFGTVKKSYKQSEKSISEMFSAFGDVNSRILSGELSVTHAPKEQVLASIDKSTSEILTTFNSNFTETPLVMRNRSLVSKFSGLDKRVYDSVYGDLKGFIRDTDYWTKFIPEELIKGDKEEFLENLMHKKRVITNTPEDNYKELQTILAELQKCINTKNSESIYMLKSLKLLSKVYAGASGCEESIVRKDVIKKINSVLADSKKSVNSPAYMLRDAEKISELLNKFGKVVNTDKKGAIEELLTIYKQILPPEEYIKLKKIVKKATKSINKSVRKEGSDYVDKLRDLSIGSALTDVSFGLAVPMTASAVAISTADTKDKKRSVALKYAIPIFVGIGTCMLCTVKLIAGGKALLTGALSSIGANQIGEFIDDKLSQKSNTNNNNTISTTTKKEG